MFARAIYFIAAALLAFASEAHARVDYAIDLTSPEHHLGQVSIRFPATPGPYLDVKMAAWRTGRYEILPLANGVRRFSATGADGRPLAWKKIDKSTWRIRLPQPGEVRVGYELYGNELGLRTRHIDDSHAFLNASATFMYADRYRDENVSVALKVPRGWNSISGMRSTGPHVFVAPNWDILVDSPIETGVGPRLRFTDGGRDYEVAIWGDGNYDARRIVADLKRMVPQARSIWSSYPFQRYVFMIHATDGARGATEHINSTIIQVPRTAFQPRDFYLRFLTTAAHEFVHTWNVKAYRGANLVPYDYQEENYSDLLWIAEGSTTYFADHLLLRAGIMLPNEYFARLAGVIDRHRHKPGVREQSVAEASFDQWLSPSGDRANNATVDIYSEGQIVSWMLDIALLQQTNGRVSYRDVHDALYRRFPADRRGFTAADVRAILRELTGTSWDAWWARNVDSPASADVDRLLAPVGLKLSYPTQMAAWSGWSGESAPGGVLLNLVERGSPAWNAGFTPGDVIVAIDGQRVTDRDSLASALRQRRPGETLTVTFIRRSDAREKRLTLGSIPNGDPSILPVERPTAAQKALFERWLLIPYPDASAAANDDTKRAAAGPPSRFADRLKISASRTR